MLLFGSVMKEKKGVLETSGKAFPHSFGVARSEPSLFHKRLLCASVRLGCHAISLATSEEGRINRILGKPSQGWWIRSTREPALC